MEPVPYFDELHVISDLHLGGSSGFQIFDLAKPAEKLIDHLRINEPQKNVALLINGDLVDFLAEPSAKYFDPEGAVKKLDRISQDPSFSPVWNALKRFVGTTNRNLVITLGNHDLELALPWMREHLLQILSNTDAAARGRIILAFDGVGFRCQVGTSQILCVHGNEVDPWNITDFEHLRRIGRDLTQGRRVESWVPNAGTNLVIDIMNGLKRRFPFIDLLKPEAEAVVPTLLALDSSQVEQIAKIAAPLLRLSWDSLRIKAGFLLGNDPQRSTFPSEAPLSPEGPVNQLLQQSNDDYADILLKETEKRLINGVTPLALVAHDRREDYLGFFKAALNLGAGKEMSEVLRSALDTLERDRSFALTTKDFFFQRLDKIMGNEFDFLLAGHTHMERALPRTHGSGYYFNSGTWVRKIKLSPTILQSPEAFLSVFKAFATGTMEALDAEPGLVLRAPTVVSIWKENAITRGELRHIAVNDDQLLINPIEGTRFPN